MQKNHKLLSIFSALRLCVKSSFSIIVIIVFFRGCSSSDEHSNAHQSRYPNQKAEYIYRKNNESLFTIAPIQQAQAPSYPWDKGLIGNQQKINKEYFRCKGNSLNPCNVATINNEVTHLYDCGGIQRHGLPLKNGKEFIYPILIDLTNYIQSRTNKRVVITSGYRCPEHNKYIDSSIENQYSKHMIGAEASFYVHGMENQPEVIVQYIQEFYQQTPRYIGQKEYQEFRRYDKNSNTITKPWYNKEIFIKLFRKDEGRNFDNRHPYPYISIQVRHDRDTNESVVYSWDKARKNYLRW